jgi:hypothetical protein
MAPVCAGFVLRHNGIGPDADETPVDVSAVTSDSSDVSPWCCCALAGTFCAQFCERCASRALLVRRFRRQLAAL